jgi:hypothetical protein
LRLCPPADAFPTVDRVEERLLRLEDPGLSELVERAQRAQTISQLDEMRADQDPSTEAGSASDEQIRQAVIRAESKLVRRVIEAARQTQQRRAFASLGRR